MHELRTMRSTSWKITMTTVKPQMTARIALLLMAIPLQAQALTPAEVFERVKESVFVVKTFDAQGKQKGLGSAVLLPIEKFATNCHVVEGGARFEVGRGDRFSAATLYAGDIDKDICLLDAKVVGGKPGQLGNAGSLKVGAPVYAVGAPRGLELSLSDGIVAQLRGGPPPFIQTGAANHVAHTTTIAERIGRNADCGENATFVGNMALVMIYSYWEDHYREQIATARRVTKDDLKSDVMGDMRWLRQSIIHHRGIATNDVGNCKVLLWFAKGEEIFLSEQMFLQMISYVRAYLDELRSGS
jgi:Trypsin-like peptidase domain